MTLQEIQDYKDAITKEHEDGYVGMIQLHGYTSTSLKKDTALNFAWENKNSGHEKVLFHIQWHQKFRCYFLNAGAFDHEEEVLLYDGAPLTVLEVTDVTDKKENKLYTLISLTTKMY